MRVVLDTNVVVSGVIKEEGPPGQILTRLFQARQFISVTSLEILAEIREVLQRPKIRRYHGWTDEEIDAFVTFLYAESDVTEGTQTVNIARDPQDNKFLACASEGNADYLVSGDDDLLQMEVFERTQIVRPRAFLETLQSS
jgi:putative PIN family toxin of toxin-antitoxin system